MFRWKMNMFSELPETWLTGCVTYKSAMVNGNSRHHFFNKKYYHWRLVRSLKVVNFQTKRGYKTNWLSYQLLMLFFQQRASTESNRMTTSFLQKKKNAMFSLPLYFIIYYFSQFIPRSTLFMLSWESKSKISYLTYFYINTKKIHYPYLIFFFSKFLYLDILWEQYLGQVKSTVHVEYRVNNKNVKLFQVSPLFILCH